MWPTQTERSTSTCCCLLFLSIQCGGRLIPFDSVFAVTQNIKQKCDYLSVRMVSGGYAYGFAAAAAAAAQAHTEMGHHFVHN